MTLPGDSEEERRRRRRAIIRTYHPDRGGDPAEFISMLQGLKIEELSSTTYPEMRFARRRRWWQGRGRFRLSRRHIARPKRVI